MRAALVPYACVGCQLGAACAQAVRRTHRSATHSVAQAVRRTLCHTRTGCPARACALPMEHAWSTDFLLHSKAWLGSRPGHGD